MNSLPKLTPITSEWMNDIIHNPEKISNWIEKYGSPLNIHSLENFQDNYEEFHQILKKYQIPHQIYFARKANKIKSFLVEAKKGNFGIDTASFNEMKQAIETGLHSKSIVSTAAIKTRELLQLALENEVVVVMDNLDELDLANQIATENGKKLKIGIRISGFSFEGSILYTRFGFPLQEACRLIVNNLGKENYPMLQFEGLHFHLNGYSYKQRAECLLQSLDLVDDLLENDIQTKFIDIGGGILMNYLEYKNEWDEFHEQHRKSLLEDIPEITIQKDSLGIVNINGKLHGKANVYPYYNELNKGKLLEKILLYTNDLNIPIFQLLKEKNIELRLEPGRAMLDQCGITVAKVTYRKTDVEGRNLIGLEMNRTQLCSSSADFLLDPVHIPQAKKEDSEKFQGYLVGAYCLEQEFILKRRIEFQQKPAIGDFIIFVNTAGYMMHFYESEAHLFELAKNVVLQNGNIFLDEDYFNQQKKSTNS